MSNPIIHARIINVSSRTISNTEVWSGYLVQTDDKGSEILYKTTKGPDAYAYTDPQNVDGKQVAGPPKAALVESGKETKTPLMAPPGWYAGAPRSEILVEVKSEVSDGKEILTAYLHGYHKNYKLVKNLFSNQRQWVYEAALYRYEQERERVSYLTRKRIPEWISMEERYTKYKKEGSKTAEEALRLYLESMKMDKTKTLTGSSNTIGDLANLAAEGAGNVVTDPKGSLRTATRETIGLAGAPLGEMARGTVQAAKDVVQPVYQGAKEGAKEVAKDAGIQGSAAQNIQQGGNSLAGAASKAGSNIVGGLWNGLPTEGKVLIGGAGLAGGVWVLLKMYSAFGEASLQNQRASSQKAQKDKTYNQIQNGKY